MTAGTDPAPQREEPSPRLAWFILYTGPASWFVQFLVNDVLASWPCFPRRELLAAPLAGYGWSGTAILILTIACALLAAASALVAWRTMRAVAGDGDGGTHHLLEVGDGRTRFVAVWGLILGTGASLTILVELAGYSMVPRCAA